MQVIELVCCLAPQEGGGGGELTCRLAPQGSRGGGLLGVGSREVREVRVVERPVGTAVPELCCWKGRRVMWYGLRSATV